MKRKKSNFLIKTSNYHPTIFIFMTKIIWVVREPSNLTKRRNIYYIWKFRNSYWSYRQSLGFIRISWVHIIFFSFLQTTGPPQFAWKYNIYTCFSRFGFFAFVPLAHMCDSSSMSLNAAAANVLIDTIVQKTKARFFLCQNEIYAQ